MTVNVILSHRNHLRVSIFIQFEIVCEHTTEEDYISGSDVDVCFFFFANKKENKKNSFVFWRRTPMNIYWFHGRQKKNTENNTESDKNNGISFDAQKLLYSTNWNQFDSWKLVQVSQSNAIFWFFSFCFFFLQFDNLERRSKVFAAYFAYESIETHSFDHEEEESQTETFQQTDDGRWTFGERTKNGFGVIFGSDKSCCFVFFFGLLSKSIIMMLGKKKRMNVSPNNLIIKKELFHVRSRYFVEVTWNTKTKNKQLTITMTFAWIELITWLEMWINIPNFSGFFFDFFFYQFVQPHLDNAIGNMCHKCLRSIVWTGLACSLLFVFFFSSFFFIFFCWNLNAKVIFGCCLNVVIASILTVFVALFCFCLISLTLTLTLYTCKW